MPLNAWVSERYPSAIAKSPSRYRDAVWPAEQTTPFSKKTRSASPAPSISGAIVTNTQPPMQASTISRARSAVAGSSHSRRWTRRNFGLRNGPSK